jgi:hypothetical protein
VGVDVLDFVRVGVGVTPPAGVDVLDLVTVDV